MKNKKNEFSTVIRKPRSDADHTLIVYPFKKPFYSKNGQNEMKKLDRFNLPEDAQALDVYDIDKFDP